jgi:hypothetical protein
MPDAFRHASLFDEFPVLREGQRETWRLCADRGSSRALLVTGRPAPAYFETPQPRTPCSKTRRANYRGAAKGSAARSLMQRQRRKRRSSWHWTKREDAFICRLRRQGKDRKAIADAMPGRTRHAVFFRIGFLVRAGELRRLRPDLPAYSFWTAKEDALLVQLRAEGASTSEIAERLPHRTRSAIRRRARSFVESGLIERQGASSPKKWTREDNRRLEEMRRERRTVREIAVALRRTADSVSRHMTVKLRKGEVALQRRNWTTEEDALLVQLRMEDATTSEIAARLPQRSLQAIALRARRFVEVGLIERQGSKSRREWTREENRRFEEMLRQKKTVQEIATALRRGVPSVRGHIRVRNRRNARGRVGRATRRRMTHT